MIAKCPSCEAKIKMPGTFAGRHVNCPKCKFHFMVPNSIDDDAASFLLGISSTLPVKAVTDHEKYEEVSDCQEPIRVEDVFKKQERPQVQTTPKRPRRIGIENDVNDSTADLASVSNSAQKRTQAKNIILIIVAASAVFVLYAIFIADGKNEEQRNHTLSKEHTYVAPVIPPKPNKEKEEAECAKLLDEIARIAAQAEDLRLRNDHEINELTRKTFDKIYLKREYQSREVALYHKYLDEAKYYYGSKSVEELRQMMKELRK